MYFRYLKSNREASRLSVRSVARSRQVCIYWLWKHCLLLSILPGGRANTYRHKKTLFGRLLYDSHSLYESGTPSIRYFQSIMEDSTSGRGISSLSPVPMAVSDMPVESGENWLVTEEYRRHTVSRCRFNLQGRSNEMSDM